MAKANWPLDGNAFMREGYWWLCPCICTPLNGQKFAPVAVQHAVLWFFWLFLSIMWNFFVLVIYIQVYYNKQLSIVRQIVYNGLQFSLYEPKRRFRQQTIGLVIIYVIVYLCLLYWSLASELIRLFFLQNDLLIFYKTKKKKKRIGSW